MNKNQQEGGKKDGEERELEIRRGRAGGEGGREERERDVFSERRPERQRAINVLFSKFWLKEK